MAWEIPDLAFRFRQSLRGTAWVVIASVLIKMLSFSCPIPGCSTPEGGKKQVQHFPAQSSCSSWLVLCFELQTTHLPWDSRAAHGTPNLFFWMLWSQPESWPLVTISKFIRTLQEAPMTPVTPSVGNHWLTPPHTHTQSPQVIRQKKCATTPLCCCSSPVCLVLPQQVLIFCLLHLCGTQLINFSPLTKVIPFTHGPCRFSLLPLCYCKLAEEAGGEQIIRQPMWSEYKSRYLFMHSLLKLYDLHFRHPWAWDLHF